MKTIVKTLGDAFLASIVIFLCVGSLLGIMYGFAYIGHLINPICSFLGFIFGLIFSWVLLEKLGE